MSGRNKKGNGKKGKGGNAGGERFSAPEPAREKFPPREVTLSTHLDWSRIGETVYQGVAPIRFVQGAATTTVAQPLSALNPLASEFKSNAAAAFNANAASTSTPRDGDAGGSVALTGSTVDTSRKLNHACLTCGRRVLSAFCCCKGDCKELKGKKPSKNIVNFYDDEGVKIRWKVCDSRNSPTNSLVFFSETTHSIDGQIVDLFQNFDKKKIADLKVKPHTTTPWLPRASDLTDAGGLFECFSLSPRTMSPQYEGPAAVGSILHEYLTIGCCSELGRDWADVKSKSIVIDPDDLNIRVHGSPDAMFRGLPVEFKTVNDMNMISGKMSAWLKQISVYQILNNRSPAFLVVCSRDTFEIITYEVSPDNVEASLRAWRTIFDTHTVLRECLQISREYAEHCQVIKANPSLAKNDRSFFQLEDKGTKLFSRYAVTSLLEFESAIQNQSNVAAGQKKEKYKRSEDIDIEACVTAVLHFKKAIKILETSQSINRKDLRDHSQKLSAIMTIGVDISLDLFVKADALFMDTDENNVRVGERHFNNSIALLSVCEDSVKKVQAKREYYRQKRMERKMLVVSSSAIEGGDGVATDVAEMTKTDNLSSQTTTSSDEDDGAQQHLKLVEGTADKSSSDEKEA